MLDRYKYKGYSDKFFIVVYNIETFFCKIKNNLDILQKVFITEEYFFEELEVTAPS